MAVLLGSINPGIGSLSTIPATLKSFVSSKGLFVAPLKFRGYGKTSKGYVIFNSKGTELVEIEPYSGYSGDKWLVKSYYKDDRDSRLSYHKSLKGVVTKLKDLKNKDYTGFTFRDFKQYI
jgi:hypothetical protein